MRKGHGTVYVLGFAAGICLVCSLAISSLAIGLAPLKEKNIEIDKKKNVLAAAGLMVEKEQVLATFKEKVIAKVVDIIFFDGDSVFLLALFLSGRIASGRHGGGPMSVAGVYPSSFLLR